MKSYKICYDIAIGSDCMAKRITTDDYLQRVFNVFGNEYSVLEDYKNQNQKILVRHNLCETEYRTNAGNFMIGHGCAKCYKNNKLGKARRLDIDVIEDFISGRENGKFELVSTYYKNGEVRIKSKHLTCGTESDMTYQNFKNSCGCSCCAENQRRKSHTKTDQQFKNEVFELWGDEYEILGEYLNVKEKLLVKHVSCGNEYLVQPDKILNGRGCPRCRSLNSHGCKKIEVFLKNNKKDYVREIRINECKNKRALPFDFAVLEKDSIKLLIEYDGEQHFKEIKYFGGANGLKKRKYHDKLKDDYCIKNNIRLLRINFTEDSDIESILKKELL